MYTRGNFDNHQVRTPGGSADLKIHLVGPHPILCHFLNRMTFSRIVNSCLTTQREGILDHAQTLSILIQNIILSPSPLYRIAEWAAPISPSALGISDNEKESVNDDRMARTLDVLVSSQARNLFFRIALRAIKDFNLDTQQIHNDTTTVTFHGCYSSSINEPKITHGINKDHRPDLKQIVFGYNVTADGAVPISHKLYSGNRTDDTIHLNNVEHLRKLLGRNDFIYVADSKLCTRKNLNDINDYGGKFVTVLPRSRAEDKLFRKQLREGLRIRRRKLLVLENKRRKMGPPDVYWGISNGPETTAEGYRIIWYRSSQKAELDYQIRESNLEKTRLELFDLDTRLNRGKLKTGAAIKKKLKSILEKRNCQQFLKVKVISQVRIQTKRLHAGRPTKNDPIQEIRKHVFRLQVKRDKAALRAEARTDGIFPLVTNLQPEKASKKKVLLIYKYQAYVEKRHALFKSELEIAPVYLKKPLRAAGLVHVGYLAMTVDALIERTLRQNMQRHGIKELPILPEGRPTSTPTTARLLEMFSGLSWYEFKRGEEIVTFPIKLSKLQKQLLKLLDMDPSTYN